MKLPDILALHPGEGADAAALSAGIATAVTKRGELAERLAEAEKLRGADVLTTDDKTLMQAERDATAARLAMDRIDAILLKLRADLDQARAREVVAELQADAAKLECLIGKVERWQEEAFPRISELIGAGIHAEREAIEAYAGLVARIDTAFVSQAVRDAAPDGIPVKAPGGHRPSHLFPTWSLPTDV